MVDSVPIMETCLNLAPLLRFDTIIAASLRVCGPSETLANNLGWVRRHVAASEGVWAFRNIGNIWDVCVDMEA